MTQYTRSHEPVAWSLFGAGGVVLAFLTPALIIVTGFIMPLVYGASDPATVYQQTLAFSQHWIGKAVLLIVIALPLFHAAHRIFHGFHDLHIHGPKRPMLLLTYGSATLLSALCAMLLLML